MILGLPALQSARPGASTTHRDRLTDDELATATTAHTERLTPHPHPRQFAASRPDAPARLSCVRSGHLFSEAHDGCPVVTAAVVQTTCNRRSAIARRQGSSCSRRSPGHLGWVPCRSPRPRCSGGYGTTRRGFRSAPALGPAD